MDGFFNKIFKANADSGIPEIRERYGTACSVFGIICNLFLCSIKILCGIIIGSISVLADGFNNLSDIGSSLVSVIGFKLSSKPADSDHPFGHGRIEYMSAFIVSVLIIIVGADLLKSSAVTLINGKRMPEYGVLPIVILIISVLVKFFMFLLNRKVGKKISSELLIAAAKDSFNDVITSFAILVSIVISQVASPKMNIDAVMGILVSLFIIWSGLSSGKNTIDEILGKPPEKQLIDGIENTILSFDDFLGVHDLVVHNYGKGRLFASVHVEVPQTMDIVKCHERIDLCEKLVNEKFNVSLVIHMDPVDSENTETAEVKSKLLTLIKDIDENLSIHDFRITDKGSDNVILTFDLVIPSSLKLSKEEMQDKVSAAAKLINPKFSCIITFDNDFS